MNFIVKLYSNEIGEIYRFLESLYDQNEDKDILLNCNSNLLEWNKKYKNPTEMVDIIGIFIENNDKYKINMWLSLDKNIFINVTDSNADSLIRYIYERYPW